jgi:hypothetical protein
MSGIMSCRCLAFCATIKAAHTMYTPQPYPSDLITMHIAQRLTVQDMREVSSRIAVNRGSVRRSIHGGRPGNMSGRISQNDGQERLGRRYGADDVGYRSIEAEEGV